MRKRLKVKVNHTISVLFAVILVISVSSFLLLPDQEKTEVIGPDYLLANSISPERYISSDELAHKIISGDPSLLIVDVRLSNRFKSYSIPGATNIPVKEILNQDSQDYLKQEAYEIVLYSDNNFYSDQAWVICNRMGYKNLRVLEGGMHSWFNSIINPPQPDEKTPSTEHELYSFRKSASMFFGVAYPDEVKTAPPPKPVPKPKIVAPVKKKKKKIPEGGC